MKIVIDPSEYLACDARDDREECDVSTCVVDAIRDTVEVSFDVLFGGSAVRLHMSMSDAINLRDLLASAVRDMPYSYSVVVGQCPLE